MTTVENLIKALEAAESTLRRIAVKNEQVAEATLTQIKEGGGDATKWPGGWFEDIAEAALGRASICKGVIAAARAETHNAGIMQREVGHGKENV